MTKELTEEEKAAAEAALDNVETKLDNIEEQIENTPEEEVTPQWATQLVSSLTELRTEVEGLRKQTGSSPELAELMRTVQGLQTQLETLQQSLPPKRNETEGDGQNSPATNSGTSLETPPEPEPEPAPQPKKANPKRGWL